MSYTKADEFRFRHFGDFGLTGGTTKRAFGGIAKPETIEAARIQLAYESRKNQCPIHFVAKPGCDCD